MVAGLGATKEACLELLRQAETEVELFSYDLDPLLFDHEPFIAAAKAFLLHHRNNRILLLLQTSERIQKEGHRLINLAQRLPSKVEIRRPAPEYSGRVDSFLVVDKRGFVRLKQHGHLETELDLNNRLEAGKLHALFREMWERGTPEIDLRRLAL